MGMDAILSQEEVLTALPASNLNPALREVAELNKRGVLVPHDMSVIAFPVVWCVESLWPSLPSRRSPLFEIRNAAVDAFFESGRSSQPIPRVIVDCSTLSLSGPGLPRSAHRRDLFSAGDPGPSKPACARHPFSWPASG